MNASTMGTVDDQVPTGEEAMVVARAASALIDVSHGSWRSGTRQIFKEKTPIVSSEFSASSIAVNPVRHLSDPFTEHSSRKDTDAHNGGRFPSGCSVSKNSQFIMAAPSAMGSPADAHACSTFYGVVPEDRTPPRRKKRKDIPASYEAVHTSSQETHLDGSAGHKYDQSLSTPRKKQSSKRPRLLPYSGVRLELGGDLHHREIQADDASGEDQEYPNVPYGEPHQISGTGRVYHPSISPTMAVHNMAYLPYGFSGTAITEIQSALYATRSDSTARFLQQQACTAQQASGARNSAFLNSQGSTWQSPIQFDFNISTAISAMQHPSGALHKPKVQMPRGKTRKLSSSSAIPHSPTKAFKAISGRQQAVASMTGAKKNMKALRPMRQKNLTNNSKSFSVELTDCEEMHVTTFVTTSSSVERALKYQVQTDPILQRGIAQENLLAPRAPPCNLSELLELNDVEKWPLVRIGDCFRVRYKSRWGKFCGDRTRGVDSAAVATSGTKPFSASSTSIRVKAPHGQVGMEFTLLPKHAGSSKLSPTPTPPTTPSRMKTPVDAQSGKVAETGSAGSIEDNLCGGSINSVASSDPVVFPARINKGSAKLSMISPQIGASPSSSKARNRCLVSVETLYWDVCARCILCLRCGKRPRDVAVTTREVLAAGTPALAPTETGTESASPMKASSVKTPPTLVKGSCGKKPGNTGGAGESSVDGSSDACKCTHGNDLLQAAPMRSTKGRSYVQSGSDDSTDIYVKVPRHRTHGFDNDWMKNLPRPRFSKDEIKAATSGHHGTSTGLRTPKPMLIRITEKVYDVNGRLAAKTVFGGFVRLTAKNGCVKLKEDQKGRYLSTVQTGSSAPTTT